jgi:hypothetical protein
MCNNNQQVTTKPATPRVTAASPSVAASPTSLSDAAATTSNNDEEGEEASVSTYYCWVYFESEKAGSKDLHVLFAMSEGHDGLNFLKHTDPPFMIESKIYVKQTKQN